MSHALATRAALLQLFSQLERQSASHVRRYAQQPFDPRQPLQYWVQNSASAYTHRAAAEPQSKKWLLHPWMPIDVRLPALIGVLGMAGYLYLDRTHAISTAESKARSAWEDVKRSGKNLIWATRDTILGGSARKTDASAAGAAEHDSAASAEGAPANCCAWHAPDTRWRQPVALPWMLQSSTSGLRSCMSEGNLCACCATCNDSLRHRCVCLIDAVLRSEQQSSCPSTRTSL